VTQIPGQRAEQIRVGAIELFLIERRDQLERALPRLGEPLRNPILDAGLE